MYFLPAARTLLAATLAFQLVSAHNIILPAHGIECFHETLQKGDEMTVTYQVGDREFGTAGNLDVDFWVSWWPFGCGGRRHGIRTGMN